MGKPTARYEEGLKESLADSEEAAAYLNAALEEGSQGVFLLALRDVAKARGVSKVADLAELNRENAYRLLSAKGNPRLSSLNALLRAVGLRFSVQVEHVES